MPVTCCHCNNSFETERKVISHWKECPAMVKQNERTKERKKPATSNRPRSATGIPGAASGKPGNLTSSKNDLIDTSVKYMLNQVVRVFSTIQGTIDYLQHGARGAGMFIGKEILNNKDYEHLLCEVDIDVDPPIIYVYRKSDLDTVVQTIDYTTLLNNFHLALCNVPPETDAIMKEVDEMLRAACDLFKDEILAYKPQDSEQEKYI